jgi:hypothetical protein
MWKRLAFALAAMMLAALALASEPALGGTLDLPAQTAGMEPTAD